MMPTEVIQVELRDGPPAIRLRGETQTLFVVVTDDGRPVDLFRIPSPVGGVLQSIEVRQRVKANLARASSDVKDVRPTRADTPVSIIVPTRERPDDLTRCLESLVRVHNDSVHEVIVVDSGPTTDRTAAVVRRFGVRYESVPLPGANRARNAGVRAAHHEIVAFVDDDVVVSETWLPEISAPFADQSVGCVTGLVLPLELETDSQEQFELYSQYRRDLHSRVYSRSVLRPSAASRVGLGANMAFRRDVVLGLGGFDARFGPGMRTRTGDETDMFARVLDAGSLIVYTPDAYVWHRHRRSVREVRSCLFGYGVGTYGVLTKRLFEQLDLGVFLTAGWCLAGPLVKAAIAQLGGRPTPSWNLLLAETAGAACGPLCFGYEAWRSRAVRADR